MQGEGIKNKNIYLIFLNSNCSHVSENEQKFVIFVSKLVTIRHIIKNKKKKMFIHLL